MLNEQVTVISAYTRKKTIAPRTFKCSVCGKVQTVMMSNSGRTPCICQSNTPHKLSECQKIRMRLAARQRRTNRSTFEAK